MAIDREQDHWSGGRRHRRPLTWPHKWCWLVRYHETLLESVDPETGDPVSEIVMDLAKGWQVLACYRTYERAAAEARRLALPHYQILPRMPYHFVTAGQAWHQARREKRRQT